eukprot:6412300-Amphidinium_carterae.1
MVDVWTWMKVSRAKDLLFRARDMLISPNQAWSSLVPEYFGESPEQWKGGMVSLPSSKTDATAMLREILKAADGKELLSDSKMRSLFNSLQSLAVFVSTFDVSKWDSLGLRRLACKIVTKRKKLEADKNRDPAEAEALLSEAET